MDYSLGYTLKGVMSQGNREIINIDTERNFL